MSNLVTNFDEVKDIKMFNPLEYNEFFLKAVTHEVSKNSGNKMWVLHFLPLERDNKGSERDGKISFPDAIRQYVIFENGKISNGSFVEPLLMTLIPNEADMRKILSKAVGNKKITIWMSQKLSSYTYNGEERYRLEMDKYTKTKPTITEMASAKAKDDFNNELKAATTKIDIEDAESADKDDIDDIF